MPHVPYHGPERRNEADRRTVIQSISFPDRRKAERRQAEAPVNYGAHDHDDPAGMDWFGEDAPDYEETT